MIRGCVGLSFAAVLAASAPARAAGDDPHLALAVYGGMAPRGSPEMWSVNTQLSAHLTPWIAGTFESGSFLFRVRAQLPHAQAGVRLYLVPPRPWSIAPYLAFRGGVGVLWPLFDSSAIWMGTASAGVDLVQARRPDFPPLFVGFEVGRTWLRAELATLSAKPLYFGRLGIGLRF